LDPRWQEAHLDPLLDDLTTEGELATWHSYLVRGAGTKAAYEALAPVYERYAMLLAGMTEKPGREAALTSPDERFIDHLVRLWVAGGTARADSPLATLLRSNQAWLISEVVEEAGHLIHRSPDVSPEVADAFRELWAYIRRTAEEGDADVAKASLGGFAWWFDSSLSADWTLPELVDLLARGVRIDPEFEVFARLAAAAEGGEPVLALNALEALSDQIEQGWVLRGHEKEISAVLEASLGSGDAMQKARAEVLVDRLGRAGLSGLGALLAKN
jgi:hypothetical protein